MPKRTHQTNTIRPGDAFTVQADGGPYAELLYWGPTDAGALIVTWAIRGPRQDYRPEEGPKPTGLPFLMWPELNIMSSRDGEDFRWAGEMTTRWHAASTPRFAGEAPGMFYGHFVEATGHYQARDERGNGVARMRTGYLEQLDRARQSEAKRTAPRRPGRPSVGVPIQVRLDADDIAAIDTEASGQGITRPEWVRRTVAERLGRG